MPGPILLAFALASAAPAKAPANNIVVTGHPWAPFISPMGEPFRSRAADDDTLADWFNQADRNHDGMLTGDEMQADADRFFAKLDTNHDGQIDPDELVQYEWDVAPEIQVNSKLRRARGEKLSADEQRKAGREGDGDEGDLGRSGHRGPGRGRPDWAMDQGPQGAARYALLNIPEPVAAADADFNRAISLSEFRDAALARFRLLDKAHQGRIALPELKAMLPKLPPPGTKIKPLKEEADTRVGNPLPPGN